MRRNVKKSVASQTYPNLSSSPADPSYWLLDGYWYLKRWDGLNLVIESIRNQISNLNYKLRRHEKRWDMSDKSLILSYSTSTLLLDSYFTTLLTCPCLHTSPWRFGWWGGCSQGAQGAFGWWSWAPSQAPFRLNSTKEIEEIEKVEIETKRQRQRRKPEITSHTQRKPKTTSSTSTSTTYQYKY